MSLLLSTIREKSKEKAVPLALAESAMKVVKGLVLGSLVKSDLQEKDQGIMSYPVKLADVLQSNELQQSRREAGWILLQGLLHQGEAWIHQNVEVIFMLFYSVFNKDICGHSGFTKVSQILKEFDLKLRALEALHLFLKKFRNFIFEKNKHYFKLAASMLSNCLQFLYTNSKD